MAHTRRQVLVVGHSVAATIIPLVVFIAGIHTGGESVGNRVVDVFDAVGVASGVEACGPVDVAEFLVFVA